jgi:hypothetical protein
MRGHILPVAHPWTAWRVVPSVFATLSMLFPSDLTHSANVMLPPLGGVYGQYQGASRESDTSQRVDAETATKQGSKHTLHFFVDDASEPL